MLSKWIYIIFVPLIIGAVVFLGYSSFTTMANFDVWGVRSIVDSTYIVAREKAQRIEQKIIDSDNAFLSVVDLEALDDLKRRWEHFSSVSHAVDSVYVIDEHRALVFGVSDYMGEEYERRTSVFQDVIAPMLELPGGITQSLRHLHTKYNGKYYLISYQSRKSTSGWLTICLNYDIEYIKSEFLNQLFADLAPSKLYNVVDSDGNLVLGSRIKEAGEFIVGWKIPSTLYEWRIQVAPTQASFYEATSRKKHLYDSITVVVAFTIIFLGIGMLIFMAEQERRLSRLKSEFIANVSHELKTPLSIIRLFADMLYMGKVTDLTKQKRYLESIVREGERLTALIDNVLDFSKLERGKLGYQMAEGDIAEAVSSAVELSRFKFEREGIKLDVKMDKELPSVVHDPHAMTLAVINLLDNAAKYAASTDRVEVIVKKADGAGAENQPNGKVEICVKDWGPGIPHAERKHIFDRFFRGKTARQRHQRGTGIGLTLVKSIVESHGGRIYVESPLEGTDHGSGFHIII